MIVCAAIKLTNRTSGTEMIICGHRHGSCYAIISQLNDNWNLAKKEEGFIDHKGSFYNRFDALLHASSCGQISETHRYYHSDTNQTELYSEDLY